MPRPIETLLTLPRLRLFDRVPILETEQLVQRFIEHAEYRSRLLKDAFKVSKGSAEQFSMDDKGLSTLLDEVGTGEYIVTQRSKAILEEMLSGIYGDGMIFKDYEGGIEPLCRISPLLREISKIADGLADRTKEETIDLARALLLRLPQLEQPH